MDLNKFKKSLKNSKDKKILIDFLFKSKKWTNEEKIRIFMTYGLIIKLEQKQGKIVSLKSLEKEVITQLKSVGDKVSRREVRKYIDYLIFLGIVFLPRGGFVERLENFRWKDVKNSS